MSGTWVDDAAVAPDGSPVAVYLALPVEVGFGAMLDHLDADASVLDLGCGVGRLANVLARPGRSVWGVDESPAMLAHLGPGVTGVRAGIEGLDLDRRFDAVVLASHLVNVADRDQRRALLAAAAAHLAPGGTVYLQRHDPTSDRYRVGRASQTVATARGDLTLTLEVHARDGDRIHATSTMALADATWAQTFDAELLDDDAVDAALADVGLALDEVLDPTWITARHPAPLS